MKPLLRLTSIVLALGAAVTAQNASVPDMATPQEKHLRNVHQLTFGGQNAEAYFSADGKNLIYQSSHGDVKCDQIFIMNIDGSDQHMVSTGKGRAKRFSMPRRTWRAPNARQSRIIPRVMFGECMRDTTSSPQIQTAQISSG